MRRVLAGLALALVVAGCSPKSATIPQDPAQWDQLTEKAKQLNEEDRRLLAAYLLRQGIAGAFAGGNPSIPAGMTIGKAIAEQKKFEGEAAKAGAEEDLLKAKAAAARAKAEAELNNAVAVTITEKTFVPENIHAGRFSDEVRFVIAAHNKTQKDIAGVKGTFVFSDMFGSEIKRMGLSMDDGVKAGKIFTTSNYRMDVNQFIDSDTKLAQTDLAKMKVTFHPEMIVFTDGSKMEVSATTEGN
jgi:hypothetical protein